MTVALDPSLAAARARLEGVLERHERLLVAFSGGADSALLAQVATSHLGASRVLCATAVSPSLAVEDEHECARLARAWGLRHLALRTHEVENPAYRENTLDRCYFCKAELMDVLGAAAEREGAAVALGVNLDDLGEHRPGQAAARERGAVFPLVEASLDKATVRALSRAIGLETWDKPANACLSSRVPHGTPVTVGVLSQVARAESALRALGFRGLRVRHYGDAARLELPSADLPRAIELREEIVDALHAVGYRYVTLDLEGFRSGNLAMTALAEESETKERP
ncbi:MAG TPA: ATP-dependent sacrificial sulfur transferase LarE [Acidimicrobiales bacterium]|nr:ATP-dependent sacrificial sulfur transferase LarE [Acidimicrobiales bacterium]